MMDLRKRAICNALRAWINQRPGLEPGNYISGWNDSVGRSAYRSDSRRITRQGHDARTLLRAVELADSITADNIIESARSAYSGRLSFVVKPGKTIEQNYWGIDYCTGQYWPTEYRAAACAVLAKCLWDWKREHCMPNPVKTANGYETYNGISAGDWIRKSFRREYGAAMQKRWFD